MIEQLGVLTPAEHEQMQYAERERKEGYEFQLTLKRLELEAGAKRHEATVAVKQLEVELQREQIKWGQLIRLPRLIVLIPFMPFLGIGFVVAALRRYDVGERFWRFIS